MFGTRPDAFCGGIVPRNNKTRDHADDAGSDDQKYSEFHCNLWRLWLGMSGPIVQEGCVLPMDKHSGRVVLSVLIIEPADAADKRLRSKRVMGSDSIDGRRCGSRFLAIVATVLVSGRLKNQKRSRRNLNLPQNRQILQRREQFVSNSRFASSRPKD